MFIYQGVVQPRRVIGAIGGLILMMRLVMGVMSMHGIRVASLDTGE